MAHIEERKTKTRGTRYRAMVFIGIDQETGNRKFTTKTFDTYEEANAWAANRELKLSKGTFVPPSKESFAKYGRNWLEDSRERLKRSTYSGYSDTFRRYIEEPYEGSPPIGRVPMNELRHHHFNKLYRWMRRERGLARGTIRSLHAILRQIVAAAYQEEAIEQDLVPRIKVPKQRGATKSKINPMTEEQLGRFLEAARTVREGEDGERLPCQYYALWYLMQATGMRPGEILGLKWDAVDLDARTLQVRYTLSRVVGKDPKLTPPKTPSSRRTIALPKSVIPVLKDHRNQQRRDRLRAGAEWKGGDDWESHGFVFPTSTGAPSDWRNIRRRFIEIMRRAGLGTEKAPPKKPKGQPGPPKQGKFKPSHRPYDLRHTHATLSLKAGVPAKVISGRLGHAKVAFTMDVYTAWIPGMDEGAAEAWDALLDQADQAGSR